jgi:CheY-like chemotaxis protein
LRQSLQAFSHAPKGSPAQLQHLQELYRRVHFLSAAAGVDGYAQLMQTGAVFEALLYVLVQNPSLISPSVVRTVANLVDFIEVVFQHIRESGPQWPRPASVLVVDDDRLSNRLALFALKEAQLGARSAEDPLAAWDLLQREQFDLLLLDIEMPNLNGFELCKKLRGLPAYQKTPVIYLTLHNDFEHRVQSTLSGGNDLIAKPVLPMELAAKVVMHLQKSRMQA